MHFRVSVILQKAIMLLAWQDTSVAKAHHFYPAPDPGRQNDAVPAPSIFLWLTKCKNLSNFDAAAAPARKMMRLLAAPASAANHYWILLRCPEGSRYNFEARAI
jgi:hypothetical protein